jgi:hypothetical protein
MNSRRRVNSIVRRNLPIMKIACKLAVVFLLVLATHFSHARAQNKSKITVAIPGADKYSRKEMRVYRFLWSNWQRRQTATAEVTFFGIDAGDIYTVEMKRDSNGRWVVREYMRHYQAPARGPEPTTLVAEGVGLRRLRLRSGAFIVRLVTTSGKAVPLFEYLD